MHMEMWNAVAENERIDVLRIRDVLQDPGKTVREAAEGACLVVCEVAKSGCVSLRLDDQPASVRRCRPVDVTGVHEVIVIEDSAVRPIASTMLLADDTTRRRFD
jgi:hypothetical protein